MIFLRGRINGFGKLNGYGFELRPGLNLVFAPNEGGKSTLQHFLIGMLYGQFRADLKTQRRLDAWVDRYRPWNKGEYGGMLSCRLNDGRGIEIYRFFGRDETRVEIRKTTGEDITGQYERQRNGEVLFADSHLGLSKPLFESAGIIRENRAAEIISRDNLSDRIANLAQSGDEDLSLRESLRRLQEKLDAIGSDRAPTKPYKQEQDHIQALLAERREFDERHAQYAGWIEHRGRLGDEIENLERELTLTKSVLLAARQSEAAARIRTMEEIENDIGQLRAERESLGGRADFPADQLDELNRLDSAGQNLALRLDEARASRAKAEAELSRVEEERKELESYSVFSDDPDGVKITEWFVTYMNFSIQEDGLRKSMVRLQAEMNVLQTQQNKCGPMMKNPDVDWQRIAREALEDEQAAAQNSVELAGKIARAGAETDTLRRRMQKLWSLSIVLFSLAVLAAGAGMFSLKSFPLNYAVIAGAIFAVAAGLCLTSASGIKKSFTQSEELLYDLEAERNNIREAGSEKRQWLDAIVKKSGFHGIQDFLSAAGQYEQSRLKVLDIQNRMDEAEQQLNQLQKQSEEYYKKLKGSLIGVGLSCSPGNLKFQIDSLRKNLRRFREMDERYRACRERVRELEIKDNALTGEYAENRSLMEELLRQAQVETPDEFREECRKRRKLVELIDKESSRERELSRLAEDRTLPQWKARLEELRNQMESAGESAPASRRNDQTVQTPGLSEKYAAPLLPYVPTLYEAEEQEKRIAAALAERREEYARIVERARQAFRDVRPSFDIDEDLALAERHFQELETNRQALNIAADIIQNLARRQQEVLAPQLNAAVEQRFLRLCRNVYDEVRIDPDFHVWVRETGRSELRSAEQLSRGAQDQLYFSIRFGILDMISDDSEPCPSLMDEPFAAYDDTRLRAAFEILTEEARRRQLVVFTCRENLVNLAAARQSNILRLS